jgi:triosephosphate isomerase
MYPGLDLSPPFFELGPKAYLFGEGVLELARFADVLSAKYEVPIIMTPQYVDIPLLVQETTNLLIFAQHMDPLRVGRGIGSVLPEAIKAAGAVGTLLNHAEKPLSLKVLRATIQRADELGLASMVCAGNLKEVEAVSRMNPNILIAESPDFIGTGRRAAQDRENIQTINQLVWNINPNIRILHAAGISNGKDVYDVIVSGAQATGSTSGVLNAPDPFAMLEDMIRCVREAWNDTHHYA